MMLWPVGQSASARWHQHQMQAEWQQQAAQLQDSARKITASTTATRSSTLKSAPSRTTKQKHVTKPNKYIYRRPANWPPTRLIIPDITLDVVTVQGIDDKSLRRGPGHDPLSAWPGERGNCIIAGHRNVYGSYFWRLNELGPGARIELRTPGRTYHYRVSHVEIRAETDAAALSFPRHTKAPPRLTLYTCTLPKTTQRVLVVANQIQ